MAVMPDRNCGTHILPDVPHTILWDPAPTPTIPSGAFIQVPIDTDDNLWRNDVAGLGGRIQQDAANLRLNITEDGYYGGHCAVRINPLPPPNGINDNPFFTEIELRENGVGVRRSSFVAPDGWDLDHQCGPGQPPGIVTTLHWVMPLVATDQLTLFVRCSAVNGGSFPRIFDPQYGSIEASKVAELKPEGAEPDVDCDTDPRPYTGAMQATGWYKTGEFPMGGSFDQFVTDGPFWTEQIDEGGDGIDGSEIADWALNTLASNEYSMVGGREACAFWRQANEIRYAPGAPPAGTDPIRFAESFMFSQPNINTRDRRQQRRHQGAGCVIDEGLSGMCNHNGGTIWLNNDPLLHAMRGGASPQFFGGMLYQYGARAACTILVMEVAP